MELTRCRAKLAHVIEFHITQTNTQCYIYIIKKPGVTCTYIASSGSGTKLSLSYLRSETEFVQFKLFLQISFIYG
jgi:hypothetical protein